MGTSVEAHLDKGCGSKFAKKDIVQSLAYQDKRKWFGDMRQSLSLTASIIATISFQSALDPPGGSDLGKKKVYYLPFLICNTICFISSLSVCLLLVSGLSLENTKVMWFLLVGMCTTITSLLVTYLFGAMIATPDHIIKVQADSAFAIVIIVWAALFTLVSFLLILGFVSSKNNRNNEEAAGEQELAKRPGADP